ncbi:MAG: AmmeMemoRadiSam system radical SAM enzyme [Victivallales bacterium]|nr:AmmeMemoRadiSam system radical SAM enzyme [Victivallales bacterium]
MAGQGHDVVPQLRDWSTSSSELCREEQGGVRCLACAHHCLVPDGRSGKCGVRHAENGALRVPFAYVSSLACDPIEKKPLYHFLPGCDVVSYGMLGCNLHCAFCQNWSISQAGRDKAAAPLPQRTEAPEIVRQARRLNAPAIASTYNEPLVSTEWSLAVFRLARAEGLKTCYVSNGFASPEALSLLCPFLDAINVDLKCFSDDGYRQLGGRLQPVLDTIRHLVEHGVWVEATTLVVPGFNDSTAELTQCAAFLASLSPDLPWHVSAYHAAYRWDHGPARTPLATIEKATAIGRAAGLRYIYAGNLPTHEFSDTTCPSCHRVVLARRGFSLRRHELANGACPACRTPIPGVWGSPT